MHVLKCPLWRFAARLPCRFRRSIFAMPVKDVSHWTDKLGLTDPCHYQERWMDRYAATVRKLAVRRIWPREAIDVVDFGCGDGKFGQWASDEFHCKVTGVDPFDWPGAADRLHRFKVADAERLDARVGRWDLSMAITSLPFMSDWRNGTKAMRSVSRLALVVDNLQTPTPPWQKGLSEKDPIELPQLVADFVNAGWTVRRCYAVGVVDRRLFLKKWIPRPLAFGVTLMLDRVLSRFVGANRARYAAVLFERGR